MDIQTQNEQPVDKAVQEYLETAGIDIGKGVRIVDEVNFIKAFENDQNLPEGKDSVVTILEDNENYLVFLRGPVTVRKSTEIYRLVELYSVLKGNQDRSMYEQNTIKYITKFNQLINSIYAIEEDKGSQSLELRPYLYQIVEDFNLMNTNGVVDKLLYSNEMKEFVDIFGKRNGRVFLTQGINPSFGVKFMYMLNFKGIMDKIVKRLISIQYRLDIVDTLSMTINMAYK